MPDKTPPSLYTKKEEDLHHNIYQKKKIPSSTWTRDFSSRERENRSRRERLLKCHGGVGGRQIKQSTYADTCSLSRQERQKIYIYNIYYDLVLTQRAAWIHAPLIPLLFSAVHQLSEFFFGNSVPALELNIVGLETALPTQIVSRPARSDQAKVRY